MEIIIANSAKYPISFVLCNIIHIFVAVKEIGDGESPISIFRKMKADIIKKEIEAAVNARGCFIVDINVSRDNDIELTIESETGVVDMDDCVAVNNAFLDIFDRDEEDYSLTVTSAGLDKPFIVAQQFVKAVGTMVEISLKGGRKLIGRLVDAKDDRIQLEYETKEAVDGKKKKEMVQHNDVFMMNDINSVMYHIDFK